MPASKPKKVSHGKSKLPDLVIRRIQLPHIAEEFAIYPKQTGAYCASCIVKYLPELIDVTITGRMKDGGRWYFHSLSKKQKYQLLDNLLRAAGLDNNAKEVAVNIDDCTYSFKFD